MKSIFFLLHFLGLSLGLMGQNFLFQNQNFFKPYLQNPALAGSQGTGNATLIYKKQLVGFDNSPNSQVISIDYPFSENKIGVGFNFLKDQNGASSYTGAEATFAYHILTSKKGAKKPSGFSFGLSANLNQFRINKLSLLTGIGELDDDIFSDDSRFNQIQPNFNVGFNFFSHGYFFGVSAYNFAPFVNPIFSDENDLQNAFTVFLTTGIELIGKEKFVFRPNLVVRTQENADYQVDLLAEVRYLSSAGSYFSVAPVFRSFSYRTLTGNQSVGLNVVFNKFPFSIGYQFDLPLSSDNIWFTDHVFYFAYQLTEKAKVQTKKKKK